MTLIRLSSKWSSRIKSSHTALRLSARTNSDLHRRPGGSFHTDRQAPVITMAARSNYGNVICGGGSAYVTVLLIVPRSKMLNASRAISVTAP